MPGQGFGFSGGPVFCCEDAKRFVADLTTGGF